MGGEASGQLLVRTCEPRRLTEVAAGGRDGDRRDVEIVEVVGVADLRRELEPPLLPVERLPEAGLPERREAPRVEGVRAELDIAEELRERAGFSPDLLGVLALDERVPSARSSRPWSMSVRSSSSTKNGLPSARPTTSSRTRAGASVSSSRSTRRPESASVSGSSRRIVAPSRPAPHAARRSRNSGRAVQTSSSGPRTSRNSRSSRSSSGSSAQCASSTSTTTGRLAASSSTKSTRASCSRSRAASGCSSPATSRPSVRPRISRPPGVRGPVPPDRSRAVPGARAAPPPAAST